MYPIFITLHVFIALGMIALILMQQGKGADIGSAFGAGASATLFGARGSANFLTRTTAILATVFFLNSILLAYLVSAEHKPASLMQNVAVPLTQQAKPNSDLPDVPLAQPAQIEQAAPVAAVQPATASMPIPVSETPAVVAATQGAEPTTTVVAPDAGAVPVLAPQPEPTPAVVTEIHPASAAVTGQ